MFRVHPTPEWNVQPHLLVFMQHHPFLAGVSRQVRKRCTRDIPTAAVTYDVRSGEIVLWYNDLFMASLTNAAVHGVLKHEFYHLVFRHLTARRRTPPQHWNIATDMAIDWLVWLEAEREAGVVPRGLTDPVRWPLPGFAKTPGRFPYVFCAKTYRERPLHPEEAAAQAIPLVEDPVHGWVADVDADPGLFRTRAPTPEERRAWRLAKLIEDAPGDKASEWYLDYLRENDPAGCGSPGPGTPGGGGGGSGAPDGGSMDEHRVWDDVPDDIREKVENEVRAIVQRAVRDADTQSNGWGHTPADVCAMIRKSVEVNVDWKAVLMHFIGTLERGRSRRSVTTRDRKYGLAQPGVQVGHTAHLVVVIDESGSVSNEMLATFFAALEKCTRKLSVTVLPFDAACQIEDAWEWRKGQRPAAERVKCGGTNFDAPTAVINEHARARGWEGAVFLTDGDCFKPMPCNVKRAWVLGIGCSVPGWLTDEPAIVMEDGLPATGAWR
jgi:predicted metal-dependent peptidase